LNKTVEQGISDIVGVFTDPIIVFPGGWGDSLPDWLKSAITMERLIENVRALKEGEMTSTDAEACAYLMTVSLTQPIDSDWTQIYLYIASKVYEKHGTKESGATMPEDIRIDRLSEYQMGELNRLNAWLYRQRIKARTEKDITERRREKEKVEIHKKAERPALFEF